MTVVRLPRFRIRRVSTGWRVTSTGGTPWTCATWREAIESVDRCHRSHVQAALPRLGAAIWAAMGGPS